MMEPMRYLNCPHCGSSNKESDQKCYSCRKPLHLAPSPVAPETQPARAEENFAGPEGGSFRIFGSLAGWIFPDQLFKELSEQETSYQDYVSHIIGVSLSYGVLMVAAIQFEGLNDSSTVAGSSLAAGLFGFWIPTLLLSLGLSFGSAAALKDHQVNGKQVKFDYASLARADLHINAIFLTSVFVAMVTGSALAILLAVIITLRSLDLQARALYHITGESRQESLKMAAVLYAIMVGTCLFLSWLT